MIRFIGGYFKSILEENRKVVWPTRQTAMRHTIMVIVTVAVAILIFASLDFGLKQLVLLLLNR